MTIWFTVHATKSQLNIQMGQYKSHSVALFFWNTVKFAPLATFYIACCKKNITVEKAHSHFPENSRLWIFDGCSFLQ